MGVEGYGEAKKSIWRYLHELWQKKTMNYTKVVEVKVKKSRHIPYIIWWKRQRDILIIWISDMRVFRDFVHMKLFCTSQNIISPNFSAFELVEIWEILIYTLCLSENIGKKRRLFSIYFSFQFSSLSHSSFPKEVHSNICMSLNILISLLNS